MFIEPGSQTTLKLRRSGMSLVRTTCGRDRVKTQKSHPREWVDGSSPAYNGAMAEFLNPTHGSGWIVQIPLWVFESRREKAGIEQSTNFRWWDS